MTDWCGLPINVPNLQPGGSAHCNVLYRLRVDRYILSGPFYILPSFMLYVKLSSRTGRELRFPSQMLYLRALYERIKTSV